MALIPELRALVEASNDVEITRRTFRDACVPALIERYQAGRKAELANMVAERLGRQADAHPSQELLDLAIAWFHCNQCRKYVRYPGVLAHRCQRQYCAPGSAQRDDFDDPYEYDVANASMFRAWSAKTLRPVLDEDLRAMRSIIQATGLDPESATARHMDDLDARLTCNEIPVPWARKSEGKLIMNWRRAVLSLHIIRDCETVRWVRVSGDEKRRAVPLEEKAQLQRRRSQKARNSSSVHCVTIRGGSSPVRMVMRSLWRTI
ncbi:uncharacterized protein B0H18DRAFT_951201 [Fomitopsis serialis]|uniref:uncharacterized protein n=1 Tax=Fomitopsis serialis TaxID=139415 RepID=UPI0020088C0C|nr:uncharacterized protein B0H18DRAFT_951201 [Neoantrodia serialis]KAH9935751.1 hypothetical protein B0H18DRAFT_951201 [Neoantrodia serialis]